MRRPRGAVILVLGFAMTLPMSEGAGKLPAGVEKLKRGADLILLHGKIWTGEPYAPPGTKPLPAKMADAVAILDGRFLAVGGDREIEAYIGPNTKVVDLQGRFAVPGLIDGHAHFMQGGFQLLEIDLKNARNEDEFERRIAAKVKSLPPGRWLLGGDWDEQAWPSGQLPTRAMIDRVTPRNPVFISRYDGHSALANSLALKTAGVSKQTPDPPGGVIVRDSDTGEPTGVLKDNAQDLVTRIIPPPTEVEFEEALRAALKEAARGGLTSVQNITVGSDSPNGSFTGEIELLRRAKREGWLTCRLYEIIPIADWQRLADAGISREMGDDLIKLGAVKAFADGSLGSSTAWMFDPLDDQPRNRGLSMPILNPPSKMEGIVRQCDKARIQLAVHAIGDRAVAEMLDIYTKAGGDQPGAYRFRIEHAQHMRPEDFARFAKLGVIASMQPYHAIDDGRWAEKRLGRERARWSYAWKSVLDAGASLSFGSDWPVAPLDPLLGIYAAVTRATLDGKHPEGWFPEERLTVEQALRAYTQGCAYAAFEEKEKGTIAPGKLADLAVLSDDLFAIPPEQIRDARVMMTIVGGKVVYEEN